MEQALRDYINAQRREAKEFSKQPGCWMGSLVATRNTQYWNERVPTGTLKEFQRIELEESAYYCIADAYSKSYARSMDFSKMSDEELNKEIDSACETMKDDQKFHEEQEKLAQEEEAKLAASLGIDVPTLHRWLKAEAA
tara:strand:- start:4338 stop:4754 length:417 start_codon:yes stop_codon:yes gene_type:complete